ncbi:RnfABCDGE type electron transport complex subunit D [Crenobacter sp. SG2305]|uniref:RnfABCDGE type electron transport complex subunit D n=1 Tax=Crenobacter oryzisoli TaxID=3056844 RepID=UPI0025AAB7D9|nr:RnfABCDGE type electron transport complex subunit D [Crenobacter sp. SG2305]MDN0083978.1 RnfABCDGE type electron transport complex subunit D [Crenobacter sp. SG2305]
MHSPHIAKPTTVSVIMLKVLAALVPGLILSVFFNGIGVLAQLALATATALLAEAAMLKLRGVPVRFFLRDGSAVLTAWLLALTMPSLGAWWLIVVATLFAIVIAKQLYGGLGNNPFNPAMAGFAAVIVAFPAQMAQWASPGVPLNALQQLAYIFTHQLPSSGAPDAVAPATSLGLLKTRMLLDGYDVSQFFATPLYGHVAGFGSVWIALAYLAGGLFLWRQQLIPWQTPVAMLVGVASVALPLWQYDPVHFANPLFHLTASATMLAAFFIVTDPVTAPATSRGRLIFGFLVGVLLYVIRVFGGMPDAVAFAVLIMNIAVPFIDHTIQPPVFGAKRKGGPA